MSNSSNKPRSSVRVRKPLWLTKSGKGLGKEGRFLGPQELVGRGHKKKHSKLAVSVTAFFLEHT